MPIPIYFRIVGHLVTLGLHGINSVNMINSTQDENLMKDPQINTMVSLQATYITVWNVFFQLLYALLALSCDVSTVLSKDDLIPKSVRKIRRIMFDSAVFPITVFIFTFFWPIYFYDRNIIFPDFIDKIFTYQSNMVMHFWILPLACWELAFLPRTEPKSHKTNVQTISVYFILYNVVIFLTYYIRGIWSYPLFKALYGTIYLPIFITCVYCLIIFLYYKQWSLTAYFWENKRLKDK